MNARQLDEMMLEAEARFEKFMEKFKKAWLGDRMEVQSGEEQLRDSDRGRLVQNS